MFPPYILTLFSIKVNVCPGLSVPLIDNFLIYYAGLRSFSIKISPFMAQIFYNQIHVAVPIPVFPFQFWEDCGVLPRFLLKCLKVFSVLNISSISFFRIVTIDSDVLIRDIAKQQVATFAVYI